MTAPWPNPPQLPHPPRTVLVKTCCGLLVNDVCECAELAAQIGAAFASPIRWSVTPAGVEAQR